MTVSTPLMKVRIGIGSVGLHPESPGTEFDEFVDALESRGIDSLWLPDLVSAGGVDAITGMAWAAARTRSLKVGTGVIVLPGRNPALLASQLATLAVLAPKRILPAFGVRAATPAERQLYPVDGVRAEVFEEALVVLRRLLSEPEVTHHGTHFTLDGASVNPRPSRPLDLWLGGRAEVGLRRVGRLADGWLGSFLTPDEAARARVTIENAAREAGREVEEDHYGTNVSIVLPGTREDRVTAMLRRSAEQRPEVDPEKLIARGWDGARELIRQFVDGGLTKFVVRPAGPVEDWPAFLDQFSAELGPLEN
ncbi:putative F420-dependent oxidoreductase [Pseudonocardia sediminis]|uniref:Putative F420-dependent oxidoreductase n=1 Tax=Pseudonocardia sediminis TaxID=1397368 RepID=A0A4Q7UW80_PSEST|nr:TIGR03854 family LLM class F420-dependent oxidoreductase [Pseudonocardia sediminis]RZT86086.1 putative F420-dependent oxidoreductase [Pseudonocardia sediminis]